MLDRPSLVALSVLREAFQDLPAKVAELADALDSGSSGVTPVRVQVPPFALIPVG